MFRSIKHIILLLISLFYFQTGFSQEKDFQSWWDIGLDLKINEKLSIQLEEGLRTFQNSRQINSFNSDFGLSYRINKMIEIGCAYRLSLKSRNEGYFIKHRGNLDIAVNKKVSQFKIEYRNRSQIGKDSYIRKENDFYPEYENRNKFKLSYNIRGLKTDPFIALELFHSMQKGTIYQLNSRRYYFGIGRNLLHDLKLNIAFILEKDYKQSIEKASILNVSIKKTFN